MQKGEVDWGDKGVKGFAKAQLKPHYQNSDPHPPASTKIKDMHEQTHLNKDYNLIHVTI